MAVKTTEKIAGLLLGDYKRYEKRNKELIGSGLMGLKDEAIDTSDIPGLDEEFFQLAKIKIAPKRADLQSIFEKFTGFLNIRFDNERKLTR